MEEKWIPKKLEKAKDSNGIPSGGQWGVPGEEAGAGKAEPPGLIQPRDSSEAGLGSGDGLGRESRTLCWGISPDWV